MTDISISAANVIAQGNADIEHGRAGATITAGQLVYKEASSGKFKLADADSGAAEARVPYGIALNGASDGQPLAVGKGGDVALGTVLTAGDEYYQSPEVGGICPRADLGTGDYITLLGIAKSTSILALRIQPSGVAVPE